MLSVDIKKKLRDFMLELKLEHADGCLGILGPSGCGKSMSLKAIAGLITPDSGIIRLGDTVLYSDAGRTSLKPQLRKTGYLFQNYALFPNMTVEENVACGLKRSDKKRGEKTAAYLQSFQLSGLEKSYPAQLSGGQQQRTALARILASSPDLLLLDEPFSALDAGLKQTLRLELLKVLKNYHGLSILVTHDKDEAYQLCTSLMVMEEGSVLCCGPTNAVFQNPGVRQAAVLTGCRNISPIRRLGSHRLLALSWNLILTTTIPVPETVTAVGIHSHAFLPLAESDTVGLEEAPEGNLIQASASRTVLSSLPFEWEIHLENGLVWTIRKNGSPLESPEIPRWLRVRPEDLLLLA